MRTNVGGLANQMNGEKALIELDRGPFAYLASGPPEGRLILCLHGFPDGPSSFATLGSRLAASGYRVVAPWLRGYAPSVLHGSLDIDDLASDVLELADALSGREFAVIGHDWGAVIAWALLARDPHQLRCACVLSVPHPRTVAEHLVRSPADLLRVGYFARVALRSWGSAAWTTTDISYIDDLWRRWSPGFALPAAERQRLHRDLRESGVAPFTYYRSIARLARDLGANAGWSAADRRTRRPVLYLHGAEDGCLPSSSARGLGNRVAGPFAAEVLGGAGHFLPWEAPDRIYTRALRWLAMYMPATRTGPLA